jgi:hypothetical protein
LCVLRIDPRGVSPLTGAIKDAFGLLFISARWAAHFVCLLLTPFPYLCR